MAVEPERRLMANFDMQELSRTIIEGLSIKSPLQHEYSWAVSDATWSKLPEFDHTSVKDPERNIALKKHLAQCWATADDEQKYKIAKWVVRDWGGVLGNSEATIKRHVKLVDAEDVDGPFEGIASYSKIFSIKDPEQYAIYDARVATSLNAIQLIQRKAIFAFPIPPGRNTEIDGSKTKQGFSDIYTRRHLRSLGFSVAPRRETYRIYLELLRQLEAATGRPIVTSEMQLFSRAVEFSKAARAQRSPGVSEAVA